MKKLRTYATFNLKKSLKQAIQIDTRIRNDTQASINDQEAVRLDSDVKISIKNTVIRETDQNVKKAKAIACAI